MTKRQEAKARTLFGDELHFAEVKEARGCLDEAKWLKSGVPCRVICTMSPSLDFPLGLKIVAAESTLWESGGWKRAVQNGHLGGFLEEKAFPRLADQREC